MKPGSTYSMHPGFAMMEAGTRNLRERTGKTLQEWIQIVQRDAPRTSEKDQRTWLREVHGFTTNYAMWVVDEANGHGASVYDPDKLVEGQYAGKKAHLRPLYDRLLRLGLSVGPDVIACPTSTFVPLFRKNVFAQIKPTTLTRIDVGVCLRGVAGAGRLIDTGGEVKGDRITHRIEVKNPEDIDQDLSDWMRRAYESG